jgi:hypothetical protein
MKHKRQKTNSHKYNTNAFAEPIGGSSSSSSSSSSSNSIDVLKFS